jgi:hypothetical protein
MDEWSVRRGAQHFKRQLFMPPEGFEPAIPASKQPQMHAFDRAATGIGILHFMGNKIL